MGLSRRMFTKEFKLAAVRRLEQGVSIGEAARALEVNPNVLHRWRREFRSGPGNAFPGNGKQRWAEGRIAELERKIGQQALEIDFLKACLQRIEEQRMSQALTGNPPSTGKSKKNQRKPERNQHISYTHPFAAVRCAGTARSCPGVVRASRMCADAFC